MHGLKLRLRLRSGYRIKFRYIECCLSCAFLPLAASSVIGRSSSESESLSSSGAPIGGPAAATGAATGASASASGWASPALGPESMTLCQWGGMHMRDRDQCHLCRGPQRVPGSRSLPCCDIAVGLLARTPLEQVPILDIRVDPPLELRPRVQHSLPRNILHG